MAERYARFRLTGHLNSGAVHGNRAHNNILARHRGFAVGDWLSHSGDGEGGHRESSRPPGKRKGSGPNSGPGWTSRVVSTEELSSMTQISGAFLPIVKPRPSAEIVTITAEMKAPKGYCKLRQESMNERLVGIRKRKTELAEKEDKK